MASPLADASARNSFGKQMAAALERRAPWEEFALAGASAVFSLGLWVAATNIPVRLFGYLGAGYEFFTVSSTAAVGAAMFVLTRLWLRRIPVKA